jgi:hypothetical protein
MWGGGFVRGEGSARWNLIYNYYMHINNVGVD